MFIVIYFVDKRDRQPTAGCQSDYRRVEQDSRPPPAASARSTSSPQHFPFTTFFNEQNYIIDCINICISGFYTLFFVFFSREINRNLPCPVNGNVSFS